MRVPRSEIIAEAIAWIGTPYQHQMSVKGEGCDCLGLIRGLWRAFYGPEPTPLPPYTPDWAECCGRETLDAACARYFTPIAIHQACPGDVLVFRMQPGAPIKHIALIETDALIIHAYWGRSVTRSFLKPFWQKRCAGAYQFPELKDPL